MKRFCAYSIMTWALVACGARVSAPGPKVLAAAPARPNDLHMDGAVIAAQPDPLIGLDVYDPALVFHLAGEAERNDRPLEAERIYGKLVDEFPESEYAQPARFNLGLLLERRRAYADALPQYEAIVQKPEPEDAQALRTWIDAHYRLGACAGQVGRWWDTVVIFERILKFDDLDDLDRMEALLGRAIGLQESGLADDAEVAYAKALRFYREVTAHRRFDDRGFAAEAAFRMGDIAKTRYDTVVLEFPQELMRTRLEQKCELLLSAQNRYLQSVRYGDAHTVAVAGLRIGGLYESLHVMIVGLSAPTELTLEQLAIYHEEVRDRVHILLTKALRIYEKTLRIGRTSASAGEWVAKLEASVARLRALYLSEPKALSANTASITSTASAPF